MNSDIIIEKHPWEPYIPNNTRVLILGTFPPKQEKWSMDFYYPNKINDFWRIMGIIFHADKEYFYDKNLGRFNLDEIKSFLNIHGIALHDTAREVKRLKDNASDKYLEIIKPLPLNDILPLMPSCNTIVSTGEKAAQVIASMTDSNVPNVGKYVTVNINNISDFRIYRMPSTSRAYPLAIEKKAEFYRKMFHEIGILK